MCWTFYRYSVIIPSYNRPEMLQRALASVYGQTLKPTEILLMIDETADWAKYEFLKRYDERLKVTFTGGGIGGAGTRNLGLDQVGNVDYVFFLDDDDEWLPEKTQTQIDRFETKPNVIYVGCNYIKISSDGEVTTDRSEKFVLSNVRKSNLLGGFSCFGFRLNLVTRGLRLNGNLPRAQDFDFYIKVTSRGQGAFVERPLVKYYVHEGIRITNRDLGMKYETIKRVIIDNHDMLSFRERLYVAGQNMARSGPLCFSASKAFWFYSFGVIYMLLSFPHHQLFFSSIRVGGVRLMQKFRKR